MPGYHRFISVPVEDPLPAEAPPLAEAALLAVADDSFEAESSPTSEASSTSETSPHVKTPRPAKTAPPAETSDESDAAIIALKDRFRKATDLQVWVHCMGGERVSNIPTIADKLADHIILVCIDCEHWSSNTDEATEVGIATFSRQDVLPLVAKGDHGDYGEHLMQQAKFYLLRITETSHLPNKNPASRGVEGNRFGQGRFVSFSELRQIMYDLFAQPIEAIPGLKGGNYPIVVLGHDVTHDKNNLKSKATAFDLDPIGTVVRYIDTQALVRDVKYWLVPRNEQIGLRRLVEELWFEHSDPHTAANDAGRTLISAFQLGLGHHPCTKNTERSMLEVATGIEEHSVANFKSIGGADKYCWKCGVIGHMKPECTATGLRCDECEEKGCYIRPGEEHITAHCICIANKKAKDRREKDAQAKRQRNSENNHQSRGGKHISPRGRPVPRGGPLRQPARSSSSQRCDRSFGKNGYEKSDRGGYPSNGTYR